ncbi:FxsB family radical SAM/SPASM domain protein [Actinomadura graeca]|uniref:FxsB family radical SAM/SPASM domain protein n=1 Tax=Actinomadura graeca TaxID=2750812 RepID=A0ABX8QR02_9ACTN|nr:FxsB family cyclophane-forming radical SAM/SPASM peptide maturase [Actinomadura graeca]QXJ21208.1 FxsB family radical SAM/SPASM domain protein [Actinomadura graeca]
MIDHRHGRDRTDWTPTPFRQFIVKVHSRCNLACGYCYVYTMADKRWRRRPPAMAGHIAEATAHRIAEHVATHDLAEVSVILHGGEPLLAGPDRLRHLVSAVRAAVGERATVHFSLQTNGTLLDRSFLELFSELGVRIGISVDGTEAAHDRARPGSYARVAQALAELGRPGFRGLFAGLLCVVDLDADPIDTYESLLRHAPPAIDLLLPHASWSRRPAGPPGAYADWLIPIFDRWFGAPVRETGVRLFEEIINVLLGGGSAVEGVGTSPAAMIVVETDGRIEQSDILASTYEGAADLGLDVVRDDFEAALHHPATVVRQLGTAGVPADCAPCLWAGTCGGGLYAHRYRAGSGFDHRSVYCTDLDHLFGHVRASLERGLAPLR